MGADGTIAIYSKQKLVDRFGEKEAKEFIDDIRCGTIYEHSLDGKDYITDYTGDNLYSTTMLDTLNTYDPKTKEFNKNSYFYDSYYASELTDKNKADKYFEMAQFLQNECWVATWEVWT